MARPHLIDRLGEFKVPFRDAVGVVAVRFDHGIAPPEMKFRVMVERFANFAYAVDEGFGFGKVGKRKLSHQPAFHHGPTVWGIQSITPRGENRRFRSFLSPLFRGVVSAVSCLRVRTQGVLGRQCRLVGYGR